MWMCRPMPKVDQRYARAAHRVTPLFHYFFLMTYFIVLNIATDKLNTPQYIHSSMSYTQTHIGYLNQHPHITKIFRYLLPYTPNISKHTSLNVSTPSHIQNLFPISQVFFFVTHEPFSMNYTSLILHHTCSNHGLYSFSPLQHSLSLSQNPSQQQCSLMSL